MSIGTDLDTVLASLTATDQTIAAAVAQLATELLTLETRVAALEDAPSVPFGSARMWELPQTVQDNLNASRTFHSGCPSWFGGHKASTDPTRPGFVHVLSIRPDGSDKLEAFMASLNDEAQTRPDERFVVCAFHEPEDDQPPAYIETQLRIHPLATAANVETAVILMGWTFNPVSGRDPQDWVPRYPDGTPAFDVFGVDLYDPYGNDNLGDTLDTIETWAAGHLPGVPLLLAELGTHTPYHAVPHYGRPETWTGPVRFDEILWLEHVLTRCQGWVAVCWFNSWVGAKGPWWMPDTIQQWVTK